VVATIRRKNEKVLSAFRAAIVAFLTAAGFAAMSAKPPWLIVAVGTVVAVLSFISSELGVLAAVFALSVPVIAAQPVFGFAMLIVLIASVRYLGGGGARGFILIGVSLVGAFFGPVWAGVALAGYILGASEGAVAAGIACIVLELTGLVLGRPTIGATITGGFIAKGHPALLAFGQAPSLLSGSWVAHALTSVNAQSVGAVTASFSKIGHPVALVIQPLLWALGAAVAGMIAARLAPGRRVVFTIAAVVAGVAITAAGAFLLADYVRVDLGQWVVVGAGSSAVLAAMVAVLWDAVFPHASPTPKVAVRKASMATEDADVDELLRLIATAEDKLTSQHTSERVVMITDMKSFSRMTEEDGSVATAKAIQRHRDLLLPIVTGHRGAGKSTGGDGLVAAFESAEDAVLAAVEMQRALVANNKAHPGVREIWIRTGLASGEVVLDKGGRPFIGAGLNLAARVMNLADGGQIFATGVVASAAPAVDVRAHSFGEFELKNIHRPIEILEILWAEDQAPRDPRDTGAAAEPEPTG